MMEKSANCGGRDEQQEGDGERAENLDEERLRGHTDIIQEKRPLRPPALGPAAFALRSEAPSSNESKGFSRHPYNAANRRQMEKNRFRVMAG